jgi:hypothetical protein
MQDRAKEVEVLKNKLVSEGHTCVCFRESFPPQICWCEQTPCSRSGVTKPNDSNIDLPEDAQY